MGQTVSGSVWPCCYAAHKGSGCNLAEKQTVCVATIIRAWVPCCVLYIYVSSENLSPQISITPHSFPHTTPDCLGCNNLPNEQRLFGTSVGKSKESGHWQIIRRPKWDKQWVGVGAKSLKAGQGEEMKINTNIKSALLLLTFPGLVAVHYG